MKRLSILRHAKSSRDDRALADFDRPLNNRGWKAARRLGCEIKDRGMHFDLCVASTAARVRETLDGLFQGYGEPDFEVRFEPEIYDASLETLLDVVRGLPETSSAALLVGHNPGVHQLVLGLARHRRDGLRAPRRREISDGRAGDARAFGGALGRGEAGMWRDCRRDPAKGTRLVFERVREPVAKGDQLEHVDCASIGLDRLSNWHGFGISLRGDRWTHGFLAARRSCREAAFARRARYSLRC